MRAQLDGFLGRFTMYRLVLSVLTILLVYSLVLDLLGWLTFGIGAMLLSALLSVAICTLVSWVLAKIFRVKAHLESSLITGLLVYFLFWPTLDPTALGGIALAAALAGASKFLLAYRRRHIFNPAAIGAFLVSLTGLNLATWWTATPAMLWLLIPAALLVLYRSSKLIFAGIFVVVAAGVISLRLIGSGLDPATALSQPFGSLPVLFFVGFMLSEPLTLPPRRYQQWLLAGVVGLLFSVPFQLGPIFSSPELALLIGNLLSFLLGQRRGLRLKFNGSRELTRAAGSTSSARTGRPASPPGSIWSYRCLTARPICAVCDASSASPRTRTTAASSPSLCGSPSLPVASRKPSTPCGPVR